LVVDHLRQLPLVLGLGEQAAAGEQFPERDAEAATDSSGAVPSRLRWARRFSSVSLTSRPMTLPSNRVNSADAGRARSVRPVA
jgi:hypothetical protein